MEHSCPKCGAPVVDGTPFCRQCSAPQIRVAAIEPASVPAPVPTSLEGEWTTPPPPLPLRATRIDWSHAIRAAAVAAVASAFMLLTPIGVFGLGMLAGGFLAVILYKRSKPGAEPTPTAGATLGVISGSIGFVLWALLKGLGVAIFHTGGELRAAMIQAVQQAASRSTDPQAQAAANWLESPPGLTLMMVLTLFFTCIIFLILSGIGGAIAAAILRKRAKHP